MTELQKQTVSFLTRSYGNLIAALTTIGKINDESNEHKIYRELLEDLEAGSLTYKYAKKHILSRLFYLSKHNVKI